MVPSLHLEDYEISTLKTKSTKVQYETTIEISEAKTVWYIAYSDLKSQWTAQKKDLKKCWDKFLLNVLDQPGCDGYIGLWATASNSLTDQGSNMIVWSWTKLRE